MPRFNPGDRVRRISSYGGHNHIVVGSVYIVQRTVADIVYLEGERGGLYDSRFELVEAAPPPVPMQEVVTYLVYYKWNGEQDVQVSARSSEASAIRFKRYVRDTPNLIYLASKKIKTNIPMVEN